MKILDSGVDKRGGCKSILTSMTLREYKSLAIYAFENSGNIHGQRNVIKRSSTAAKIKKRMADDFKQGAIFPQVVLGLLCSKDSMENMTGENFYSILDSVSKEQISIIDGMQRSGIYFGNSPKFLKGSL